MNVLVVEDEFMVAKRLKRFIVESFDSLQLTLNQLKSFDCIDDAECYIATHSIDILFLDLNLHSQDGFELLKKHVSRSFQTIVVSANTERALEAFEFGVLDFVAKPFTQARISKAIERFKTGSVGANCKYLTYKSQGKIKLLSIDNIAYIRAAGHYTEVITKCGETVLHDKNLDALLLVLPQGFFRFHRSYAAPINNIISVNAQEGSRYMLVLQQNIELPVGRTKIKALKQALSS